MAYKYKLNPITGKLDLVGGEGGGSGVSSIVSSNKSIKVTEKDNATDLSLDITSSDGSISINKTEGKYDATIPALSNIQAELTRKKNRPSGKVDTSAIEIHDLYIGDTSSNVNPFVNPTLGDFVPIVRAFSSQKGQVDCSGRFGLAYYKAGATSVPSNFPSLDFSFRFIAGESQTVSLYLTSYVFDNKGDNSVTFDPTQDILMIRIDKGKEGNEYGMMAYFQRYEYILLVRYKWQYSKFSIYEDYRQIDPDKDGNSNFFVKMYMWCTNMPKSLTSAQKSITWDKVIDTTDVPDPRNRTFEWWGRYLSRPDFRECFCNTTTKLDYFTQKYGSDKITVIPCLAPATGGGTEYKAGENITINNNVISADLADYLNKSYSGTNVLNGSIQVGSAKSQTPNSFLNIRNVSPSSVTGSNVNGAGFAVSQDGTSLFTHKTYNNDGSGAKNDATLRFSGKTGLQFAINTGSGDSPSESMYKNVAMTEDLENKQDKLTAGPNITIEGNVISATGGGADAEYTAGYGIDISTDNTISAEVGYKKGEVCDDAARSILGGDWRMPTKAEFDELITNCTWTWTYILQTWGYKVASKVDGNNNWIFLPADGFVNKNTTVKAGPGFYWSSSLNGGFSPYYLYFDRNGITTTQTSNMCFYGHTIRPVSLTQGVDLGLPSGLKWASRNLTINGFAEYNDTKGSFFAWGETSSKSYYGSTNYALLDLNNYMIRYNSTDNLTTLQLGSPDRYTTAHGDEIQTKIAGNSVSKIELKEYEGSTVVSQLGYSFYQKCLANPSLLLDIVFYTNSELEDKYGKPSWIKYDNGSDKHFIISINNIGDYQLSPDGNISKLYD